MKINLNMPSNKKFGLFFAIVFAIISINFFITNQTTLLVITFLFSLLFLISALLFPKRLFLLNKLWFELGLFLGKFISPFILGVFFFLIITPVAFFMRMFKRDALSLKKRRVKSYWINKKDHEITSESFHQQF